MITLLATTILVLPSVSSFAVDSIESCFVYFPNRYLEKSGAAFLSNLTNARECQHRCLITRLKNGAQCRSAMWKRDTTDCVLSRYNRFDRYESYRIAPNLEIDYYENICIGKEKLVNRDTRDSDAVMEKHRDTRTTIAPHAAKYYQPKRRSIGSGPPISHRLDDPPIIVEKTRLIRPGPVPVHYFRGSSRHVSAAASTTQPPTTTTTIAATTKLATTTTVAPTTPSLHVPPPTVAAAAVAPPQHQVQQLQQIPLEPAALVSESTIALKPADCFTRKPNIVLKGFEEATILNLSVPDCLQRCIEETKFFCASVNYELTRKLCVLNGGSASLNGKSTEAANVDYYENGCPPKAITYSTSFSSEPKQACFQSQNGMVLLDLGGELITTNSLESCQSECARTGRASPCAAVNWLPQSKTCMVFAAGYNSDIVAHPTASFHKNLCSLTSTATSKTSPTDYDYH